MLFDVLLCLNEFVENIIGLNNINKLVLGYEYFISHCSCVEGEYAISDFIRKSVIYIAFLGIYNGEYIFKYGLSRNVFRR